MTDNLDLLNAMNESFRESYQRQKVVLSFDQYMENISKNPSKFIRNASKYVLDTFEYFGKKEIKTLTGTKIDRYAVFDVGTEQNGSVIGGEFVHKEMITILQKLSNNPVPAKLIVLHGPNGSAKTWLKHQQ